MNKGTNIAKGKLWREEEFVMASDGRQLI